MVILSDNSNWICWCANFWPCRKNIFCHSIVNQIICYGCEHFLVQIRYISVHYNGNLSLNPIILLKSATHYMLCSFIFLGNTVVLKSTRKFRRYLHRDKKSWQPHCVDIFGIYCFGRYIYANLSEKFMKTREIRLWYIARWILNWTVTEF